MRNIEVNTVKIDLLKKHGLYFGNIEERVFREYRCIARCEHFSEHGWCKREQLLNGLNKNHPERICNDFEQVRINSGDTYKSYVLKANYLDFQALKDHFARYNLTKHYGNLIFAAIVLLFEKKILDNYQFGEKERQLACKQYLMSMFFLTDPENKPKNMVIEVIRRGKDRNMAIFNDPHFITAFNEFVKNYFLQSEMRSEIQLKYKVNLNWDNGYIGKGIETLNKKNKSRPDTSGKVACFTKCLVDYLNAETTLTLQGKSISNEQCRFIYEFLYLIGALEPTTFGGKKSINSEVKNTISEEYIRNLLARNLN
jgi:hypothetical protein